MKNIDFLAGLFGANKPKLPVIGDGTNGLPPVVAAEQLPLGTVADLSLPAVQPVPGTPSTSLPPITPANQAAEQTAAAPQATALPAIGRPSAEVQLAELNAKDYSIEKDDAGNVIRRGKDRDKKWSTADKILSAITGWANGGIVGGIKAATDRNYMEKMGDEFQRARLLPAIEAQRSADNAATGQALKKAQVDNIYADNATATERLDEMKADRLRKVDDRKSREQTSRMVQVAGMFKNIPVYDPADPKFAELTKALGDVNLPITPKDAKKNVQIKQDQRTGQWTTILTDPVTGKQETRDVLKDGKPFASTPTVVMQGEYGLLRQNDQQDFNADQNQRDREMRANMEAAKVTAQSAFKQMEAAQGRLKALQSERAKYIAAYQKQMLKMPTEEQINDYLNAVAGQ